ncbi:MAG: YeiH family protein [Tepidisphaeraceae bacterium]
MEMVAIPCRPALHTPHRGELLRRILFLTAMALCFTPWMSPPEALALGAVLAIALGNPFVRQSRAASRWLLQSCVVLLGFGMNLIVVLKAGKNGVVFAALTIVVTLLLGYLTGRLLRVRRGTSLLISAGTAICGGSAIAAVGSAVDADEGDMTVAMGVVFLLNGAALYLFPPIGHALGLSQHQFGVWAGIAIHDVSSVVGAASRYGMDALQTATAVKLSRALWIVPITLAIAFTAPKRPRVAGATFGFDAASQKTPRRIQIPWFIGFFLLASILRSEVPGIARIAPLLSHLATAGLTLTLFLVGAGLSTKTLRAVGVKALGQGVFLWLFISAVSLWAITHLAAG